MAVRVQREPFDPGAESNAFLAGRDGAGAMVTFTGLVRSTPGNSVRTLTLECYPDLALNEIAGFVADATKRFGLLDATVIHRFGPLAANEPIVLVITLASHRRAAFEAAEFLMDHLKTDAPFWKTESSRTATRRVPATAADTAARSRWDE